MDKVVAKEAVCAATGMRVVDGAYAIGDCATIVQTVRTGGSRKPACSGNGVRTPVLVCKAIRDRISELWREADTDGSKTLNVTELNALLRAIQKDFPHASGFVNKGQALLKQFDADGDGSLSHAEFEKMVMHIDSRMRALPGTAQVAKQQAVWLAEEMNAEARGATDSRPPFQFQLQGEMAYVGKNVSVAGLGEEGSFVIGDAYFTNLLWRAAYWWMLPDARSMAAVPTDWLRTVIFGRDSSCWEHARAPAAPAPARRSEAPPSTGDEKVGAPSPSGGPAPPSASERTVK
jgi:NADH dehydrogenase FAD-containing subunit